MSDILILRARLRKRDKDIQQAMKRLQLEEGEMADMVRDGFRRMLADMGVMRPPASPLTTDAARLVAKELINSLKEGSENHASKTERDRGSQRSTQVSLFAPQR